MYLPGVGGVVGGVDSTQEQKNDQPHQKSVKIAYIIENSVKHSLCKVNIRVINTLNTELVYICMQQKKFTIRN